MPNNDVVYYVINLPSFIGHMLRELEKEPLPTFSPLVLQHLSGVNAMPERIWSLLISEAAHYYLGKYPDIGDQSHYRIIGRRMYQCYPSIKLDGLNPWVRPILNFFKLQC